MEADRRRKEQQAGISALICVMLLYLPPDLPGTACYFDCRVCLLFIYWQGDAVC